MGLKAPGLKIASLQRGLSLLILGAMLLWPPLHLVLAKSIHMSTWRLFGWGMYATPNPESQSRLRVVVLDLNKEDPPDIVGLHRKLNTIATDPEQESLCINLFIHESNGEMRKASKFGLCKSDDTARALDHFMHFGSTRHLAYFVESALAKVQKETATALVFLTRQRVDLFSRRAFTESTCYRVRSGIVEYLGSVQ